MSGDATHEGHRERLRARFLSGDAAALSDPALLELLLTYAIPQRDVQPLAGSLLARFGTLVDVLAAAPAALRQVPGIKDTTIGLLKLALHFRQTAASGCPAKTPPPSENAPTPAKLSDPGVLPPTTNPVLASPDPGPESRVLNERKLQVSNGYNLDAAQLARLLHCIQDHPEARKITGSQLIEGSGLSKRQVENLVSIGTALGLVTPRTQLLTPFGRLVVRHDSFFDHLTTLEFCHFLAAGNARHLVWFEVFNNLLPTQKPMVQTAWNTWLRERLAGQYSQKSLMKHVAHEVRFIIDTYTVRNFKKLNLITETPEKTYAIRRYAALQPLTLAAMIYTVGARSGAGVVPFAELHSQPGSPGLLFALDANTVRPMVEVLHQREWLRFEVRHGLDQLRLNEGFTPLDFLAASYENRAPQPQAKPTPPVADQLLL